MNKRVGILGLLCAAAVGFFHPAVASAQDRDDYRRGGYEQRGYDRGRDFRVDNRYREQGWREARDREYWRQREWRDRCDRGYASGYAPGYSYGYPPPPPRPIIRFGFGFGR